MADLMGSMQSLMGAMQQAIQPPPPQMPPPPPPPMSPVTRQVLSQPGAPPLEAIMAQLLKSREQGR